MQINVLGVSAGNGVILHPFLRDPFKVIGNLEGRADYLIRKQPYQWSLNFPEVPHFRQFNPELFPVDVIVGHPKCGLSSMFALSRGKKFRSHKGEPSLDLFFQAIHHYTPRFFMFENLEKLFETYSTYQLKKMFIKYRILINAGSVSMYGNSQVSRKRAVVIGIRKDIFSIQIADMFFNLPEENIRTTEELLANLPSNGHITEPLDEVISIFGGQRMQLKEIQQYWKAHPDYRHYVIKSGRMNTAPGVYINRAKDIPLTVRKTNRQFNPDGIQMSPRELARIQGIPDSFKLLINAPYKTVINKGRVTVANTPPYEVGKFFMEVLLGIAEQYPDKFTSK